MEEIKHLGITIGEEIIRRIGPHISAIIDVVIVLVWVFIVRKFSVSPKSTLICSMFLLFITMLSFVVGQKDLSAFFANYAFIFFMLGLLHIVFSRKEIT